MKIIQITDTHLFADDHAEMRGVRCNLHFKKVMDRILQEDPDADLIFLTGDLSEDKTPLSYQKLSDAFTHWDVPIYWIPGNHDSEETMASVFKKNKNFNRVSRLSLADWEIIFLNSTIEDQPAGLLSNDELSCMKAELMACQKEKKIAIVMHHHPLPVQTPLIDNYILQNLSDFWETIADTKVALIISGHVHGDYQIRFKNTVLETAPATCLQWQKGATEVLIDKKIGYKVYHLDKNGYHARAKLWS